MTSITNRNTAYHSILDNLPEKRKLIFELIKENGQCTAQELSEQDLKDIEANTKIEIEW